MVSDTDWVKNGDRWRVADVGRDGNLTVTRSGRGLRRRIVLPASYVAEHVRLRYATAIHSAQGLTVDTTHVVLSGAESRQSLNVALTRRRSENHIYLADAAVEPDSLPGVDSLNPTTAEDILAGIFRRDGAQTSATSRRILDASATQLRDAVLRDHRDWGGYLTNRARRVRDLAEEVHASAADPAAGSDSRGPRRLRTPLTWLCLATSPCGAARSASP